MNESAAETDPAATYSKVPLDSLSEQFLAEHRLGIGGTIEQFCTRFPDAKDRIMRDFPKMLELEQAFQEQVHKLPAFPAEIGKYQLEEEIGRGGMGVVFASTHPSLGTELAIKLLPVGPFSDDRSIHRFHAEARACAMMDHPNIVPVYDYGIENDFAYFVMRRIRGLSLAEIVANGSHGSPMRGRKLSQIGIQAAEALQYAHDQGIIHRDVKPANMMLEEDGRLWLTDFGLAKIREDCPAIQDKVDLTMSGELLGTARYMAPERFSGICTSVCDIYGLGLTLYELAAGSRVWAEIADLSSTIARPALPAIHELRPNVPESLSRIIMKACTFRPEDRYQTVAEMCHVLTRFSHGSPKADRRKSRNSSRKRWLRKDFLIVAGSIACLLAASCFYWGMLELRKARKASSRENIAVLAEEINKLGWSDLMVSVLNAESRETRETLVATGKEFLKREGLVPANHEDPASEQAASILAVLEDYIENGIDDQELQQVKEKPVMIWASMPGVISQISMSGLSTETKKTGILVLNTMMKLSAARELDDDQKLAYTTAFDRLTEQSSEGEHGAVYKDEDLVNFIKEIAKIKLPLYLEPPEYFLTPEKFEAANRN